MRIRIGAMALTLAAALVLQSMSHAASQGTGGTVARPAAPGAIDAAFKQFWDARSPDEAARAAAAVLQSGVSVDEAFARLKRGRAYLPQAARGVVRLSRRVGQDEFGYTLDVPQTYDPSRAYQVRVQLHGGVTGREDGAVRGSGAIGSLAGTEQIYVLPNAWIRAPWWGDKQIENIRAILDSVKRSYNVDENRVVLSGVSDGGTAAYYTAMRETTMFASFLPLNGAIVVLANDSLDIANDIYANNLLNRPFFVVNGRRDPLYPPGVVEPYVEHLQRGGVDLTFRPQADGVHNTAWWPQVRDAFEAFVHDHPRAPYPARLTWQSDGSAITNRAHWIVIDELAEPNPQDQRPPLADLNRFEPAPLANFGVRAEGTRIIGVLGASAASTFDLRPDDVVTAVDGYPIPQGSGGFLDFLSTFPGNRLMTLTVQRGNARLDLRGYFSPGRSAPRPLFARTVPSGRVDLVRDGTTVQATTRGVSAFTLLLSPDVFDLGKPVKVVADGRIVFDGLVTKNLATLMKWAARDNDRTMLFDAEIRVKIAP